MIHGTLCTACSQPRTTRGPSMQTSPMCRQIACAVHSNPRIDMQRLTEVQVSQQQCHTKDLLSSKPCRQRHDSADRNRNSCNAGERETGSSVYCACHANGKCKLCVLRLPRKALCLCTAGCQAKGSRGPATATALCVLRLPRTREVRRL